MKDFFNRLLFFNSKNYLRQLELLYEVFTILEDGSFVFKIANQGKKVDSQLSKECELLFTSILKACQTHKKIATYGINALAIGVLQIWVKTSPNQHEPDYFMVNLHI